MLKRAFLSRWFPFAVAACFVGLAVLVRGEREWLLGLAGTAAATGFTDLIFGGNSAREED